MSPWGRYYQVKRQRDEALKELKTLVAVAAMTHAPRPEEQPGATNTLILALNHANAVIDELEGR